MLSGKESAIAAVQECGRKIWQNAEKVVNLQRRFRKQDSIEKDAFVPYSVCVNLDHSLM